MSGKKAKGGNIGPTAYTLKIKLLPVCFLKDVHSFSS
jgi:hypothetical protein